MPGRISPSIMCANLKRLEDDIRMLEKIGAEYLHFDIMDGSFVPNFTLGPDLVRAVREVTDIPMDLHLMVYNPENHLGLFEIKPGDIVSVHQEATIHLQRMLQRIKDLGARPAVALNPATSIHNIEDVMEDAEVIVVMTVNPGFAGQKLVPATLRKIANLKKYLAVNKYGRVEIEVDGNVSYENAVKMRRAGADIFVAGTSSLFIKGKDFETSARQLRDCIA
ncbi:MAG: ribulose-phosphate 3-epimerase [Bacillota bacterium]